jgi:hypothetical protein
MLYILCCGNLDTVRRGSELTITTSQSGIAISPLATASTQNRPRTGTHPERD